MNYISRLQAALADAEADNNRMHRRIVDFRVHLSGSKFAGYDPDGSRRDLIAIADVYAWLSRIADPVADDDEQYSVEITGAVARDFHVSEV